MKLDLHIEQFESANLVEQIVSYDSFGKPYSYYVDDLWLLPQLHTQIAFHRLNGHFKSTLKQLIFGLMKNKSLKSFKSMTANILDGSVAFAKAIQNCGGDSYQFIESEWNYRQVINAAKQQKLKYKTWKNNLIFISKLHQEGYLKRNIGQADVLAKYLAGGTDYSRQTLAIPERIAAHYFAQAISLVEQFHKDRHRISDLYDIFIKEYQSHQLQGNASSECRRAALAKSSASLIPGVDIDFTGNWLSMLRGACYVVLAAFTGCRDGEIKSFRLDAYQEKDYAGLKIPLLVGEHTKPNVGGVARSTSWVTIPTTRLAIELLWDSFEFARKIWLEKAKNVKHPDEQQRYIAEANRVFINLPYTTAKTPAAGRQTIDCSLRNFVKTMDYNATAEDVKEFNLLNPTRHGELKVGDVLVPHPHAFRRTFAVYLVRNKLASLLDLKYQFKHMNVAMTSWYSNQAHVASYFDMMADHELVSEIADEHHHYITDSLYYIYNDAETLAGPEGKRILNLRSNSGTSIYLSREEISQQVKEGRLSIIEHPTGHCTNPSCERVCDMTTCQYKVVTKEKALELDKLRQKLKDKFLALTEAKVNQPNILSKIYFEIRSIEKVLDEHQINHQKFTADITVAML